MVCRDRRRGEAAQAEIRRQASDSEVTLHIADLASLAAVRTLAEELRAQFDRVDVLVNNAGVWRARREMTDEGFEKTFAVNHLAHFLLTHLLLEPLKAAGGRVVNVSSEAHRGGDLTRRPLEEIVRGEGRFRGLQAYSDSKLANVLFTFELARRIDGSAGITTNALHPGVLATGIWNQNASPVSLFMRVFKPFLGRPKRGGEAVLRLAADPELEGVTGRYFNQLVQSTASDAAHDVDLAERLWNLSGELTGVSA
jgi:NAD(P)-dependent dehydrogenase (short-subunit alcohol dehydrogenase family)